MQEPLLFKGAPVVRGDEAGSRAESVASQRPLNRVGHWLGEHRVKHIHFKASCPIRRQKIPL